MPIPESQLQTWSNQGATTKSQNTYASIQNALRSLFVKPEIYLQGSYANSTNIRADSDVDIVAELTSVEWSNAHSFPEYQRSANGDTGKSVEEYWREFRASVISALTAHYGSGAVEAKNRCVRVSGSSGRLPADVVVCLTYRHYTRYYSAYDSKSGLGITFLDLETNRWINNFPKLHKDNGSAKNSYSRTRNNYKPTIRMFKNARNRLIRDGNLSENTAPSYFVECLFYNVPDSKFVSSLQDTYWGSLSWLCDQLVNYKAESFKCQNEQVALFGSESTKWNTSDAISFLSGLVELWKYSNNA